MRARRLSGALNADALIPAATSLVWSVKMLDSDEVARVLDNVDMRRLAVLLAAMVADDESPAELLVWARDPQGYRRLREDGFSMHEAIEVIKLREGRY